MRNRNTDHVEISLEELVDSGVFDQSDLDYVKQVENMLATDAVMEGIIRGVGSDAVSDIASAGHEIKGWFIGVESKRRYIEELCDGVVEWLKNKESDHRDLDLEVGTLKTWMKTSEMFFWRYYYLLDDQTWNDTKSSLRNGDLTELESMTNMDFSARARAARKLDSARNIPTLIKLVELYRDRSNEFFKLILARKTRIKSFPFQVVLLGASELRRAVKKIVNLAL